MILLSARKISSVVRNIESGSFCSLEISRFELYIPYSFKGGVVRVCDLSLLAKAKQTKKKNIVDMNMVW